MPATVMDDALQEFTSQLGPQSAAARSLAHAWTSAGGNLAVGKVSTRLLGSQEGRPFTAATIHAPRGDLPARLELSRAILLHHGLTEQQWLHWADEIADIEGFDPAAKFPVLPLTEDLAMLARLVNAMRDLATLTKPRAS